jgi:LuxR family maltose regulon positive regulatory protein
VSERGAAPWLATQFAIPAPPVGIIPRPRLDALLSAGLEQPVTLVCGPAGSGKTSLLSSVLATARQPPPAWVSLGQDDDEPGRLWGAILASLRRSGCAPEDSALHALAPPVRDSRRAFLPLLLNAIAELPDPVVLVLDDVHVLRERECLQQLAFLVLHAPANLRLVLSARADPPLSLHLLRVSGRLAEIRAADLAFTVDEAAELLAAHGLSLPEASVRTLWARTEGWSAGLRLAALSLQGREDPEAFIAQFAGDDRTVGDYLLAEVLDRQPPPLREFLLRTSIADRICGELADALTGCCTGADTLADLERTNGFVIGLDSRREWFRYHRLFAKLLRARARAEIGDEMPDLHRRAARWHAERGAASEALHHAVDGEEWALAAQLAARNWFDLFVRGQGAALRALVDALPPEHLEGDAELAAALACTALDVGDSVGARAQLHNAQRASARLPAARRRAYLETMAIARLYAARRDGDFEAALEAADTLLREADTHGRWSYDARRALVHATVGEIAFWANRLDRARLELTEGIELARAIDLDYVQVGALSHLGWLETQIHGPATGTARLREALGLAGRRGWSAIPATACAHAGMAVAALSADLCPDTAREHLQRAADAAAPVSTRQVLFVLALVAARIHLAAGAADEGLRSLARFDVMRHEGAAAAFEHVALTCMRARLLATSGALDAAVATLEPVREQPWPLVRATQARLLLARGEPAAATDVLHDVLESEPATVLAITRLEIAVLRAIAHDEVGNQAEAAGAVEQALELAERSGHRWAFLEAGRRMEALLRAQVRGGTAHRWVVGELIAAFQDRLPVRRAVAPLLEPLSEREQAILRFLPTTLSNREIASELFVTTNTVKTHLRSIYRKLDVARRRDAVDRARDLRLLSGGGLGR